MLEIEEFITDKNKSPRRLRMSFGLIKYLIAKDVHVYGLETLQQLVADEQVIIATSHRTDLDLPLAVFALDKHLDLAVTDMSLNHRLGSPGSRFDKLGLMAIGEANFLPIDFANMTDGKQVPGIFNPENFTPMVEAMTAGKSIVVSAQNPSSTQKFHKPGLAVPYLAAITGAPVLPVSVESSLKRTIPGRRDWTVTIGEPIADLPKIPEISAIKEVIDAQKMNERPSDINMNAFRVAKLALQQQAQYIVTTLDKL